MSDANVALANTLVKQFFKEWVSSVCHNVMITIVIDQQGHFILTELKSLFFVVVVENSLRSDISAFLKFPKGIFSAMFIQLSRGSKFFSWNQWKKDKNHAFRIHFS